MSAVLAGLPIVGNGLTVTTSQPLLDLSQTWNAAGVTFTGWKLNVTDTASASASLLVDLQIGGSSKLSVTKGGAVAAASYMQPGLTTISGLPAASTALKGARYMVSDSSVTASGNFGANVTGTGANIVPVFCDGTNWKIG